MHFSPVSGAISFCLCCTYLSLVFKMVSFGFSLDYWSLKSANFLALLLHLAFTFSSSSSTETEHPEQAVPHEAYLQRQFGYNPGTRGL